MVILWNLLITVEELSESLDHITQFNTGVGGCLSIRRQGEGPGVLHWNKPLSQVCLHWFEFTPVIPPGTTLY